MFDSYVESHRRLLQMVFTASMLDAKQEMNIVEKKPASSLVLSLGKAINGISLFYVTNRCCGNAVLPLLRLAWSMTSKQRISRKEMYLKKYLRRGQFSKLERSSYVSNQQPLYRLFIKVCLTKSSLKRIADTFVWPSLVVNQRETGAKPKLNALAAIQYGARIIKKCSNIGHGSRKVPKFHHKEAHCSSTLHHQKRTDFHWW